MNKKGAVLLTAIFLATFLSLIIAGTYPLINTNISMSKDNIEQSKLYYATESGSHYAVKWIKNLDSDEFNDFTEAITARDNFNSSSDTLSLNGMTVTMTVDVDTSDGYTSWKAVSTGLNPETDEKCRITLDSIRGVSVLEYSYFSAWTGKLGGYFTANQNFYGKCYFNGEIAMYHKGGEMTTFWGEVDSHYHRSSSGVSNYFNDPILDQFDYGLSVKNWDSGFDKYDLLNALVSDAFPYGYNKLVQEQEVESFTYTYAEMLAMPKTLNLDDISHFDNNDPVYILCDSLPAGSWGDAGYYIHIADNDNDTTIIKQDGTYEIITVPSKCGNVYLKGAVDQDLTIVTEKDQVYLDGDFYSTNARAFLGMGHEKFDNYDVDDTTHPVNQLKNDYKNIHNMAIIAGLNSTNQTHLYINKTTDNDEDTSPGDGADIILCTAALYFPKGRLYGVQPNNWNHYTKLVMFGGFIGDAEGTTESGGKGFAPNYISNPNFLTGDRPPGFKDAMEIEPYCSNYEHKLGSAVRWTLEWL